MDGPYQTIQEKAQAVGDPLSLVFKGEDTEIVINRFQKEVSFQGLIFPANAPLTALQEGFGLQRNSPSFRRFMALAQTAIGPGDPAIWSQHIFLDPIAQANQVYQGGHTHVLQMPTAGDSQVPVNTGIAAARISGLFGSWLREEDKYPDPRFGWRGLFQPSLRYEDETIDTALSIDQLLIDRFVVEGDGRLQRYRTTQANPSIVFPVGAQAKHPNTIYDIDNVSDGQALFSCGESDWSAVNGESGCPKALEGNEELYPIPYEKNPLRLNVQRTDLSYDAFRIPVLRPAGQHGIYNAQPFRNFDSDAFMVNFTTRFLGSRARLVTHEKGCDCSIGQMHDFELNGTIKAPALGSTCTVNDLKLCSESCAQAWGFALEKTTVRCENTRP